MKKKLLICTLLSVFGILLTCGCTSKQGETTYQDSTYNLETNIESEDTSAVPQTAQSDFLPTEILP